MNWIDLDRVPRLVLVDPAELERLRQDAEKLRRALERVEKAQALSTAHEIARLALHGL